jgi:hypothetical protein
MMENPYLSELEIHYPRIVEKLLQIWSLPEGENYLYELSIDVRGDREGFSQEVIAEILCLFNIKVEQRGDIWQFWIPENPYHEELNARFAKLRPMETL